MADLVVQEHNMETLQEKINRLETELNEAREQLKNEDVFRLKEYDDGYRYIVCGDGEIDDHGSKKYTIQGRRRATIELAEICRDNSRKRDLLEAYAHQIDPEWRDGGIDTEAWCIREVGKGRYGTYFQYLRILGAVYMRKETAEKICKALNDGVITL